MTAAAQLLHQEEPIGRRIDRLHLERLVPGTWRFPASTSAAHGAASYTVVHARTGEVTILQDARVALDAGGLAVLADSTFTVDVPAGSTALVVTLPVDSVGPHRAAIDSAQGCSWPAARGTANLVAHLLDGLAEELDGFTPRNPGRLAQHIVGFIALLCTDERPDAGTSCESALSRAQRYIEEHLDDPELGPEMIARAQNVSTRSLHRFFESEQLTVRGWIRSRRLEHCRLDLADAEFDHLAVSAIGARWGLWDAAHFSRTFKAQYGLSPRAYRAQRRLPS